MKATTSTRCGTWIFITARCVCSWTMANGLIPFCWASSMIIPGFVAMRSGIWPKAPRNSVTAWPGLPKARLATSPHER